MPLYVDPLAFPQFLLTKYSHLLGKKSWNVYNTESIARVQRDEAQAKACEEEDERRMQEVDAERRIQILRGERPSTPPPPPLPASSDKPPRSDRNVTDDAGGYRKRRCLAGEDDTDRDIRLARDDAVRATAKRDELALTSRRKESDVQAPLVDGAGHINLFPAAKQKAEKNPEAEAEASRKKRSYEDQYTMRFSNAAGFKEIAGRKPWYSSAEQDARAPASMSEKDVWGNEDPRRKEREKARMNANDPLAAIKRGVRQLKTTEQERKRWNEQKRREIEALKAEEGQRSSQRRRKRSPSAGSLEGFQLDAPIGREREDRHRQSSSHRHRSSHRDRSRDRSHRSHRHSSSRSHHHHDGDSDKDRRSRKPESGRA